MTILKKIALFVRFIIFYIKEVIVSNLRVAYDVLTPQDHSQPAIIALRLDSKNDWQTFFIANLISMTPGTLSMDVSSDRKTLYIHAMFAEKPEQLKQDLKVSIEKRVLDLSE